MEENIKSFENWEKEDNPKIVGKVDRDRVSCTEKWEKDYVINKILKEDSTLNKDDVKTAFEECCKEIPAPHMRDDFEECMRNKLNIE